MEIVTIHQAKTNLFRLVERAANGEEIIITRAGKPAAKLTAYQHSKRPRKPGYWKGRVVIADDFDSLPTEVAKAFRGERE